MTVDTSRQHRLPPPPRGVRALSNEQAQWVQSRFPSLPKSPDQCPTCFGRKTFRWYAKDANGVRTPEVVQYECPCRDQWVANRVLHYAGVGLVFQRYDWDDLIYKPEQAWAETMNYIEHGSGYVSNGFGLIYWGDRGNGKTLLANLLIKALLAEGHDCYVTSFTEMLDTFAGGWRDKDERTWFNRRVRNAGVLLIDDIGRERNKGHGTLGETTLEEVIRHRVAQAMPTLLTTNLDPDKIAGGYGGHTMSLLAERATMCHFEGVDRRAEMKTRFDNEVKAGLSRPVVFA